MPAEPSAPRFGMAADPDIVALLGYEELTYADGESRIVWRPGPVWSNGAGGVFGGAVASVVDHATGVAVLNACEPRADSVIHVSMQIDFMRPLEVGSAYRVTATPLRIGGRLAVAECAIYDKGDTMCIHATATVALIRRRDGG